MLKLANIFASFHIKESKMTKQKTLPTDFKIIAIKPLKDCKIELIKVLKEEQPYYFFNDYQLDKHDRLSYKKTYPDCLYDYKKLKINISAIAGKNGSGKSTISDLLFMSINNIAYYFKMKHDLVPVIGLKVALYIKIKSFHKILIDGYNLAVFDYDEDGKLLNENQIDKHFTRNSMFYSICMNYSHYAYNSSDYTSIDQQDWLSALFHKNDAYQTPIVINPWRDQGNIIINRENELVKSRLVANLLRPSASKTYDFRNITENLRAKKLNLAVNKEKFYNKELYRKNSKDDNGKDLIIKVTYQSLINEGKIKTEEILKKINRSFDFGYKVYQIEADDVEKFALDYLIRKLITVSIKYEEYNGYYSETEDDFDYKLVHKFISLLIKDPSHIAFKFKQTLNYLKHKHISLKNEYQELDDISNEIQKVIDKKKTHRDKIIELIPPPIFTVDIILEPINGGLEENIPFRLLSSGEKQIAYSMSSVLYHLVNLDSVRASTKSKVKYRHIQIVLEEIELYFHPEMQRRYVSFLRDSIINLELQFIKNISVCFVTHSPFILSDIPNSNIMFLALENGKSIQVNKSQKTFAANIHNLLASGFFMKDGLCGEFAIDQINLTIQFLNDTIRLNKLRSKLSENPKDEQQLDLVDELESKLLNDKKENHALLIRNVAEPVLASKLTEMYDQAFYNAEQDRIRSEIAALQQLLLNK